MNKKTIILIVCAVVVIAGAAISVPIVRNANKAPEQVTTPTDIVNETTYQAPPLFDDSTTAGTTVPLPSELETSTIKAVVATTKKVVAGTTKKAVKTTDAPVIEKGKDQLSEFAVLGYQYQPNGDYYYCNDRDCWQTDFGYNEMYDKYAAATVMYIDCVRVRFTYNNIDWMIQLWKGQYGWLFIGSEIGVYTAEHGANTGASSDINHYNCAEKENWLKMDMTLYWQETAGGPYKFQFKRTYNDYWWCTGFKEGLLHDFTSPRDELKVKSRITFKSAAMANLFLDGLRSRGFAKAPAADKLSDDSYFQNGADVYFLWSNYVDTTLSGS